MKEKEQMKQKELPMMNPTSPVSPSSSLLSPLPTGPSPRRIRMLEKSMESWWLKEFGTLRKVDVEKKKIRNFVEKVILKLMYHNQMKWSQEVEEACLNSVLESMCDGNRDRHGFDFSDFRDSFCLAIGIETKAMRWKRAKEEFDKEMSEVSRELCFSDDDDDIPRVYVTSSNEEGEENSSPDKNEILKFKIVRSYDSSEEEEEEEEDVKKCFSDEKEDSDSSSSDVVQHYERGEIDKKNIVENKGTSKTHCGRVYSRPSCLYCILIDLVCIVAFITFYVLLTRKVMEHRNELYELKNDLEQSTLLDHKDYKYETFLWRVNYMIDRGL